MSKKCDKRLPISMTDEQHEALRVAAEKANKSMSEILTEYIDILKYFNKQPSLMIFSDTNKALMTYVILNGNIEKYTTSVKFEHEVGGFPVFEIEKLKVNKEGSVIVNLSERKIETEIITNKKEG
jgi:hypothetical protein